MTPSAHAGKLNVMITSAALLSCGLLQILHLALPYAIWSVFSFLVYGLYLCAMAHALPFSFILLLPYNFFRATTLVSGIAIEYGGFMADLGLLGEPTGAYIRLTPVYIIFSSFTAFVIEAVRRHRVFANIDSDAVKERTQRHPWVWIFFAIFILFSLFVLFLGFRTGFPLFDGTDRFEFLEKGGRAFALYIGNRMLAAFLFGVIIYTCTGVRRFMAMGLFVLMVIISGLFGEKFTSIMLVSIYVITPAYLMSSFLQKRILSHVVPAIAVMACLTIPLILVVYGWSENPHAALERLTNRMVGQGELWYVADKNTEAAFIYDKDALAHILSATTMPGATERVKQPPYMGAYYFMYHYMPPGLLRVFLNQDYVTLTLAFEPYLLEVFGRVGMILPLCFYAGIYALFLSYMTWAILRARPLSIFLAGKLLIWVVFGLAQGLLYAIFGLKTLLLLGIAMVYELASFKLSQTKETTALNFKIGDKRDARKT